MNGVIIMWSKKSQAINKLLCSKIMIVRTRSIEKVNIYTLLYLNCTIEASVGCLVWQIVSWTSDEGTMGNGVTIRCVVYERSLQM